MVDGCLALHGLALAIRVLHAAHHVRFIERHFGLGRIGCSLVLAAAVELRLVACRDPRLVAHHVGIRPRLHGIAVLAAVALRALALFLAAAKFPRLHHLLEAVPRLHPALDFHRLVEFVAHLAALAVALGKHLLHLRAQMPG